MPAQDNCHLLLLHGPIISSMVFLDHALDTTPLGNIKQKMMITNSWVEFTLLCAQ
jgi:hypothetical protein